MDSYIDYFGTFATNESVPSMQDKNSIDQFVNITVSVRCVQLWTNINYLPVLQAFFNEKFIAGEEDDFWNYWCMLFETTGFEMVSQIDSFITKDLKYSLKLFVSDNLMFSFCSKPLWYVGPEHSFGATIMGSVTKDQ